MTKIIIVAVGIVAVMSVLLGIREGFLSVPVEVMKVEKEEVIVEVQPDWALDEDAVKAAKDVIRRKELEAELKTVQGDIEALDTRRIELEKELKLY